MHEMHCTCIAKARQFINFWFTNVLAVWEMYTMEELAIARMGQTTGWQIWMIYCRFSRWFQKSKLRQVFIMPLLNLSYWNIYIFVTFWQPCVCVKIVDEISVSALELYEVQYIKQLRESSFGENEWTCTSLYSTN